MIRHRRLARVALLALLAASCSSAPAPTPTADLTAAAHTAETAQAASTNDAATAQAQQTAAAKETAQALQTSRAATQAAAEIASATAQAQPMADVVQDLYTQGYVSRTEGTFYSLPNFLESWAQINWYMWWPTGYSPADFVIRTNASWESASEHANWHNSGCGFVFRAQDNDNHYSAHLGLDGWVYMHRYVGGVFAPLGESYYGALDVPRGSASMMLVADGPNFTFFVNGKQVHVRQDTRFQDGELALTLSSGINTGFGTRCRMIDIELWELE